MIPASEIDRLRRLTGIKWARFADDVIPAWVADMDFEVAPAIREALARHVEASDLGYNMVSFDDSVSKAWADWSERRFGWRPEVERVRVFSNALQPIAAALSVATKPGDAVALITPVYSPFFGLIEKAGRRLVECPLAEHGWRLDVERLGAAVDARTKALILCNPHNPTGRVFSREELLALADFATERDLLVISDEIWQDIVYPGGVHVPFASLSTESAQRTVTVTSASKSFSLGGLCCAVAHIGDEGVAAGIESMPPHLLGAVNVLGARAAIEAWTHGEEWLAATLATLTSNRERLVARLAEELPRVHVSAPEATYLAWLDFRETRLADDPSRGLLMEARVGLSPGIEFGTAGAGFARLNFATTPEILDEIIDRIAGALRS